MQTFEEMWAEAQEQNKPPDGIGYLFREALKLYAQHLKAMKNKPEKKQ